jgi:hypothetical protein
MPPYTQVQFNDFLFVVAVGLGLVVAVILARGSDILALRRETPDDEEEPVHEFGGGVSEANRPVPWLIWLLFIGYFVWAAAYVLFIGARGM